MGASLPHELLDEILSYLSPDDEQGRRSLRNCSLVAKSWTNPSRRHFFKTVEIWETTLQSWLDTIPPGNDELLQHVRSLSYIATWRPAHRIKVLQDYFPSLYRLQHLSLSSVHIPSDISRQVEMFSAFDALSHLTLKYCKVTISALVTLINCFSNLDRLDLNHLLHEMDGKPSSPLSRPLIRKLHLSGFPKDGLGILYQLSELGPAFDELVIDCWSRVPRPILSSIVDSLGINAKCIRLLRFSGMCTYKYENSL